MRYAPIIHPSCLPPSLSSTLTLASLPLFYTARHNSSRTLVPFSPSSVGLRAYSPSFSRVHENIAPSFSNRPRSVPLSQTSFRYNSLLLERHGRPRAARLTVARISASLGRPHTTSAGQQIPRPSNYPRAEFRPLVFRFKCPCAGFFRGATARATALSFPLFLCSPFPACLFSLSLSLTPAFSGVERLLKIDDPLAPPPRRRPTFVFSPVPIGEKRNGRESGFDYPEPSLRVRESFSVSFYLVVSVSYLLPTLFPVSSLWSV